MSSALQNVQRRLCLIPAGYLPDFTPAHHEDSETGNTVRIWESRTKPVSGNVVGCICIMWAPWCDVGSMVSNPGAGFGRKTYRLCTRPEDRV